MSQFNLYHLDVEGVISKTKYVILCYFENEKVINGVTEKQFAKITLNFHEVIHEKCTKTLISK